MRSRTTMLFVFWFNLLFYFFNQYLLPHFFEIVLFNYYFFRNYTFKKDFYNFIILRTSYYNLSFNLFSYEILNKLLMFLLCIYNTENHIHLTIKLNLDDKCKKIYKIKNIINVIYLYFYKFFFYLLL